MLPLLRLRQPINGSNQSEISPLQQQYRFWNALAFKPAAGGVFGVAARPRAGPARQEGDSGHLRFRPPRTDGQDLRREPLETRKATLASLLRGSLPGLRLNEHLAHDGESVFWHACKMGLEAIVSKRLGSRYCSGRSKDWLKFKNPDAPAVKREAEEDWAR